jgi:thiol-disulfide isomerase/thioredoxin
MLYDVTDQDAGLYMPNDGPAVLVFHSLSCPHCHTMMPKLESLAARFPQIPVLRVEGRAAPMLAKTWGVNKVPIAFAVGRRGGHTAQQAYYLSPALENAFLSLSGWGSQ